MTIAIVVALTVILNLLIWLAVILLPWKPWDTREVLDAASYLIDQDLSDVTVLIPARNEEQTIGKVLSAVMSQGRDINIVLVDDCSNDRTVDIARETCGDSLRIIRGQQFPRGWSGKVWALDQGLKHVTTDYTLLLDADILLQPGIIATAMMAKEQNRLVSLSLMAWLSMENFLEKLMMPAFVYFFKLLYPFRLSNFNKSKVAAAAGGFILVDTSALREINAFECIKNKIIDDCALAKKLKSAGYATWTGLTHSVKSIRRYPGIKSLWTMVERTAFVQLRHSLILLLAVTLIMLIMFWGAIPGLCYGNFVIWIMAWMGLTIMLLTYIRTLSFYHLSFAWSLTLPVAAMLYLLMTWSSAIKYWRKRGVTWKDRTYD